MPPSKVSNINLVESQNAKQAGKFQPNSLERANSNEHGVIKGFELSTQARGSIKWQYDAVNPGPLVDKTAKTFFGGKYNEAIVQQGQKFWRGGNASLPDGEYFIFKPPKSIAEVRIDWAVKPEWINPETGILQGRSRVNSVVSAEFPPGTVYYYGPTSYQGGGLLGWCRSNSSFCTQCPKHRPFQSGVSIKMIDKSKILSDLIFSLRRLVEILELEPNPVDDWARQFWNDLQNAEQLKSDGFTKDDLVRLSISITSCARPFSDYGGPGIFDPKSGKWKQIAGTEDFRNVSDRVFELAGQLRISDDLVNKSFGN